MKGPYRSLIVTLIDPFKGTLGPYSMKGPYRSLIDPFKGSQGLREFNLVAELVTFNLLGLLYLEGHTLPLF